MARARTQPSVEVKPLDLRRVLIPIIGDTELITHQWSEKAKRQMLDKQMKKAVAKKEAKDPEADYESSIYRLPDGSCGMPASAFKAAIVGGCRQYEIMPMTQAKVVLRVAGEFSADETQQLVRIKGEPRMREDMVRLETGVADLRYRAGFPRWSAVLDVRYNANIVSLEQLLSLVDAAGMGGVGEWRPSAPKSASGTFGCFSVDRDRQIETIG